MSNDTQGTHHYSNCLFFLGGTFPLLVSYAGQSGGQTISITATGTDGARFTNRISFAIPSKPHLLFDLDDFI